MTSDPVKVVVTSVDAYGHLNSALGIAQSLQKRGNDVYFANRKHHRASVEKRGLKFIALEDYEDSYTEANADFFVDMMTQYMEKAELTPMERLETWDENDTKMFLGVIDELKHLNNALTKIVDDKKPDIMVADVIFALPLFVNGPIPCIPLYSASPLILYYDYGISPGAGLSINGDRDFWKIYRDKEREIYQQINIEFSKWFTSFGLEPVDIYKFASFAKYFGIYVYPEALDYGQDLGPPPSNWVRMDFSIREPEQSDFTIPESLANKPGKLIYLSMGSLGSVHIPLMKRLINTFSKSKHRFIVSKGPRGDALTLPDNMWGENYVNQLAILPKVDLVLTHGGNNTTVESLYFGKKMIILPMFYDQLDNAQRLEDLKLGLRVDPFRYDEDEIHKLVDELLENTEIQDRITKISDQLKNSKSREKVLELIEKTARTKSSPL
ncbi:uncharacterized UDP-glucosyltransferase YdhE-like [Tetranychus urticae]|uniref:UDP-glycosyltransferase 204B2 n=1 Tax=Tetranychus urticae TaxID=32264 RepID=T1JWX4_TETUR|nr:uncharacterized UDP-glucosyltransferase YdhE-like [Tetranychus urticae]AHX56908.1 UDP-glycosyltransferase 204B2 [Tetranychus urticae]